jgi:hypothetical protein
MPAMPFGTLTQDFTPERRERIEKKKNDLRNEIDFDKFQVMVTEWESESGSMPDPALYIAGKAIEFAVNDLLDELEPLHDRICNAIVELLQSGPGINGPRYQDIAALCGEAERWVSEHRPPDLVDQALDIVSKIPDCDEHPDFPTLSELGIIRQALLSVKAHQQP